MKRISLLRYIGSAFAILLSFAPTTGRAQSLVPVTVLIKEEFGRADLTAIVRIDRSKYSNDIIAIKRAALTPELLNAAISALSGARNRFGNAYSGRMTVEFTVRSRPSAVPLNRASLIRDVLSTLRTLPEKNVPNIGRAKELVVSIPL